MRIMISTTNRHVPIGEPTGYIFTYDLNSKQLLHRTEINEPPYMDVNPNPRGGLRGQKGFCLYGDQVGIVNSSTIFIYDKNWIPKQYFFHPCCTSIHELAITEGRVWITSTGNDLLVEFDREGKLVDIVDLRTEASVAQTTGWKTKPFLSIDDFKNGALDFRDPRKYDMVETDKAHINSVFAQADGTLLLSLGLLKDSKFSTLLAVKTKLTKMGIWKWFVIINSFLRKHIFTKVSETKGEMLVQAATGISAVVKFDPKTRQVTPIMHFSGTSVPSHSVRVLQDGSAIYLNSSAGELVNFDLSDGHIIFTDKVGSKFLRGARQLPDGNLILGDGNHFILYDLAKRSVIERVKFTEESAPSVFDFCVLPEDFDLPPASLVEQHEKYLPLDQINMPK